MQRMSCFKATVPAVFVFVSLSANGLFAQTDTTRTLRDSLIIDEYRIYQYEIPFTIDAEIWGMQYDVLMGDEMIIRTKIWPIIHIYPCTVGSYPCTFDDVNGDGIRDIIFMFPSGGSNGAEDIYLYSLNDSGDLWAKFEGLDKIFRGFIDVDKDSIPEIKFFDLAFDCWPEGCFGAPRPMLIWKWMGEKYRLANLKFHKYILAQKGWKDEKDLKNTITWWIKTFYNKPGYGAFPPAIAHVTIEYIYAGEFERADSAFNELWPPEVAGKNKYNQEIWLMAKSSPYWQQLLESDW